MNYALARMLPAVLALVVACAPQAVAAQDNPQPEPDATYRVRLPNVQSSVQFDPGACVCQASESALAGQPVPNQYIVLMHEGEARASADGGMVSTAAIAAEAVAQAGGELLYVYDNGLDGFAAVLPPQTVAALEADPRVAAVVPDTWVVLDPPASSADGAPTLAFASGDVDALADADYAAAAASAMDAAAAPDAPAEPAIATAEWGLDRIDQRALPLNNNFTAVGTGTNVHIYIMDSGVRTSHLEFQGRVGRGASFVSDGMGSNDCNGHGTHVAGTALGTTMGVSRNSILHNVRVMDRCGRGSTSGIIAGINWINANVQKPAVVNMSLGGSANSALDAAVSGSIAKGITYVVAAGNNSINACNVSPARVPAAITVGATDRGDYQASFSNFGSCVDLYAPGVDIRSAGHTADGARRLEDGTSMAAPHVAGAAALYLSRFPTHTPAQVATALRNAATVGRISVFGTGSPNRLLFVGSGNQAATTCSDLARNGGFEQGGTQWTQSSALGFELICTQTSCGQTIAPYAGTRMAWLGGAHNEIATLSQEIVLPAGKNALLGFWYHTASSDQCGFDRATISAVAGGKTISALSLPLCTFANTAGWQHAEVNLAAGAGKTVRIQFGARTDSSLVSSIWFDSVSLMSGEKCVTAADAGDALPATAQDEAAAAGERQP